jgi:hypothetical protein
MERFLRGLAIIIFIFSFFAPIIYGAITKPSILEPQPNKIPDEIIYPVCWISGFFSGLFWLVLAEILKKLDELKPPELEKAKDIKLPELREF